MKATLVDPKPVPPPSRTVVVEMTYDEARAIRKMFGRLSKNSDGNVHIGEPNGRIYPDITEDVIYKAAYAVFNALEIVGFKG